MLQSTASPFVERLLVDQHCYLVRNCIDLSEQTLLFHDMLERSNTEDNSPNQFCMHPTPKTIIFNGNQSTLKFGGENIYCHMIVQKANAILQKDIQLHHRIIKDRINTANGQDIKMSVAVIRYPVPNGNFPEHVDHCNDNSWVYLLSLGCAANFVVKDSQSEKQIFQFKSGDVLVFDPSTEAAIVHGVPSIVENDFPDGCPRDFQRYRFGVQCRVALPN